MRSLKPLVLHQLRNLPAETTLLWSSFEGEREFSNIVIDGVDRLIERGALSLQ